MTIEELINIALPECENIENFEKSVKEEILMDRISQYASAEA